VGTLGTFQMTTKPDDAAFDCHSDFNSHIPYPKCTDAQLALRLSYIGPCGSSMACAAYFRRIAPDPVQLQGQEDGAAAAKANAAQAAKTPVPAGREMAASSTSGEIYGPPVPPGFYDEQNKKALEKARNEYGSDNVVDLGGGKFAKIRDGKVEMCDRGSCEMPVPAENVEHPEIQKRVTAEANRQFTGAAGGVGANSAPSGGPNGASAARNDANPNPQAPPVGGNPSAFSLGQQASDDQRLVTASGKGSGVSGKGGGTTSAPSSGDVPESTASADKNGVIARTGLDLKNDIAQADSYDVTLKIKNIVLPKVAGETTILLGDGTKDHAIKNIDETIGDSSQQGEMKADHNTGAR